MPKFYPRKSGNGYTNTYDAHLPVSKLKLAGFVKKDGTIKEYDARVEQNKIILEHKEYLSTKD